MQITFTTHTRLISLPALSVSVGFSCLPARQKEYKQLRRVKKAGVPFPPSPPLQAGDPVALTFYLFIYFA